MNINNLQQSRLVKYLSSYLAFVFIVLQVVDIISEPFAFSENLIVYLVYFFAFILVFVVLAAIKSDKKTNRLEDSKKSVNGNKVIYISLSIILVLIILNVYQFINIRGQNIPEKVVNFGELSIQSEPKGASVKFAKIDLSGKIISNFTKLGNTPLDKKFFETGDYLLKIEMRGWNPLVYNIEVETNILNDIKAFLFVEGQLTDNMAFVRSGLSMIDTNVIINDFYIDKNEVTNDDFLKFIINGGYQNKILWPEEMNIKGEKLKRDKALKILVDKTGNSGPRKWSRSMYASGEGQKPVSGITWYEANAYSKFVGKRLPSFEEWWRAALGDPDQDTKKKLIRQLNFGGLQSGKLNNVGNNIAAVSEFGVFDMAGNIREWTNTYFNKNKIIYVGGSWKDPEYIFDPNWRDSYPPWLSDDIIGFRCAYSTE